MKRVIVLVINTYVDMCGLINIDIAYQIEYMRSWQQLTWPQLMYMHLCSISASSKYRGKSVRYLPGCCDIGLRSFVQYVLQSNLAQQYHIFSIGYIYSRI